MMTTYLLSHRMELYLDMIKFTFSSCSAFELTAYCILLLATFAATWKAPGWIRSIGKLILLMCIFCYMINLMDFFIGLFEKRLSSDWNVIQVGMAKELSRLFSSILLGAVAYLINSITCIIRLPRL